MFFGQPKSAHLSGVFYSRTSYLCVEVYLELIAEHHRHRLEPDARADPWVLLSLKRAQQGGLPRPV